MSLWDQYQGFSELSKKFKGPNNLIATIIAGSVGIATAIVVPIVKHTVEKKIKNKKSEQRLSSLKEYKCGDIEIKQGDVITVGSIDEDIALIKINNSDTPYYISYSELLKITKKKEER